MRRHERRKTGINIHADRDHEEKFNNDSARNNPRLLHFKHLKATVLTAWPAGKVSQSF